MINVPSLDIIIKSKAAWEIGWDSFDIINKDNNYYIYVWDATGHWVWAWFIMIMVNALISAFASIYKSWALILSKTNELLKPRVKANLLMSLLMVRWDSEQKRIFMTWAGHEYLMIYKHKQNKTFRIKSWWVALWMIKDISKLLKEKEIKFEENDIIVMYSDWITEAINKPKKDGSEILFWEDRLEKTITNSPNIDGENYKSARSVFNNITIELSKFMWYKHTQLDDITLAVINYSGKDNKKNNDFKEEIDENFITEWNWD
jgi:serine phosphatase RsbU (regulator of sigma subunit)